MKKNEIIDELNKSLFICRICGKAIDIKKNKRTDKLIPVKVHLKSAHKISILDYFDFRIKEKCKFCKKENVKVLLTKINGKVNFCAKKYCENKKCINERKKINPNSIKFVSICNNVDTDEAKKIIHKRNKSPFYKINHKNEKEYLNSQRIFSPIHVEHYLNKENPITGRKYTVKEAEEKIRATQSKIGRKSKGKKFNFITNKESFIEKFGIEEGTKKYLSWKRKVNNSRQNSPMRVFSKNWYKYTYGDQAGSLSFIHRINYKKWIGTKDYYRAVFGNDFEYEKISFGNYGWSKMSQELFISLLDILSENINLDDFDIYFALKNNEKCIYENGKAYFYDFCFKGKEFKKLIEFDGDYWHSKQEVKETEKVKNRLAQKYSYDLLRVKEKDWVNNRNKVIEKCIEFILERKKS